MSLDIWFAEDIRNALLAANEGSAQTAAVMAEANGDDDLLVVTLRAYRKGYKAALITMALAFGIAPQSLKMEAKEYERAIDSRTGDGGILSATIGNRPKVRSPDG